MRGIFDGDSLEKKKIHVAYLYRFLCSLIPSMNSVKTIKTAGTGRRRSSTGVG